MTATEQGWQAFDEWLSRWHTDHPDDDRDDVDLIDVYALEARR